MEMKLLKTFADTRKIISYQDGYLLIDYLGIHYVDATFKLRWEIIDFFDGFEGEVFQKKYLLLKNERVGFKVYRLDQQKEISFLPLDEELRGVNSYLLSSNGKSLYVMTGVPLPDSMEEEVSDLMPNKRSKKASLTEYSLPNLKRQEIKPILENAYLISYCHYLDSYILQDNENNLYRYDLKEWQRMYLKAGNRGFFFYEGRQELFALYDYSVRVYDVQGREVNKLDLASDEKKIITLNWNKLYQDLELGITAPDYEVVNKESIEAIYPLDERKLLVQIRECGGRYTRVEIVDVTTGQSCGSQLFYFDIFFLTMVDKTHFTFEVNQKLHLMEVSYDQ